MRDYYQHRAREYDATSYKLTLDSPEAARDLEAVSGTISSLTHGRVLDIACGTGWLTRSVTGDVVGIDGSPTMLELAAERIPEAEFVQAEVPPLPFEDDEFDVALTCNFYGHLESVAERGELVAEALRVARELVVVEQAWRPGLQAAGWEDRETTDGTRYSIFKRYFKAGELAGEVGGEVILDTPSFVVTHSRRAR